MPERLFRGFTVLHFIVLEQNNLHPSSTNGLRQRAQ